MLTYLVEIEGYRARIERTRDGVLHGHVIEIHAPISFKATTPRLVETKFARALQDYFTRCQQQGIDPEKPTPSGF